MIGYLLLYLLGKDSPNNNPLWLPLMVELNSNLSEKAEKQGTFFYLYGERSEIELEYQMELFKTNNQLYANSDLM